MQLSLLFLVIIFCCIIVALPNPLHSINEQGIAKRAQSDLELEDVYITSKSASPSQINPPSFLFAMTFAICPSLPNDPLSPSHVSKTNTAPAKRALKNRNTHVSNVLLGPRHRIRKRGRFGPCYGEVAPVVKPAAQEPYKPPANMKPTNLGNPWKPPKSKKPDDGDGNGDMPAATTSDSTSATDAVPTATDVFGSTVDTALPTDIPSLLDFGSSTFDGFGSETSMDDALTTDFFDRRAAITGVYARVTMTVHVTAVETGL